MFDTLTLFGFLHFEEAIDKGGGESEQEKDSHTEAAEANGGSLEGFNCIAPACCIQAARIGTEGPVQRLFSKKQMV